MEAPSLPLSVLIHRSAWRGCMKSGSRRVFRYSSTHEKVLPDGFIRCRMELHRVSFARPHRTWTAEDPQSPRDPERRLLPPKEAAGSGACSRTTFPGGPPSTTTLDNGA